MVMISGFTPHSREPDQAPVRPKPVTTSSAISRMSWRSQISRTSGHEAFMRDDDAAGA